MDVLFFTARAEGHAEYLEQRQVAESEAIISGYDAEKERLMNTTALETMSDRSKREKKEFNVKFKYRSDEGESQYRTYKKRLNVLAKLVDITGEYKRRKKEGEVMDGDVNADMAYGEAPEVTRDRQEAVIKELKEKDEKQKAFSRRRATFDDEDVSYVNNRNRDFVKKLVRFHLMAFFFFFFMYI